MLRKVAVIWLAGLFVGAGAAIGGVVLVAERSTPPPALVALSCEAVYILDGATLCVPRPHVAGAAEPHPVPLSTLDAPGVVRVYSED